MQYAADPAFIAVSPAASSATLPTSLKNVAVPDVATTPLHVPVLEIVPAVAAANSRDKSVVLAVFIVHKWFAVRAAVSAVAGTVPLYMYRNMSPSSMISANPLSFSMAVLSVVDAFM
jgi:hypothetical protein